MSSKLLKTSPLRIEPQPSRYLLSLILCSYGGALVLLWLVPLSVWLQLLLSLLLMLHGYFQLADHYLFSSANAIRRVVWESDGDWLVERVNGEQEYMTLSQSFCHPLAVALNFMPQSSRWFHRHLLILPDSLDRETYRRLRVRIKLMAGRTPVPE